MAYKNIVPLTLSVCLCACGGGSSDDASIPPTQLSDDVTNIQTTTTTESTGATQFGSVSMINQGGVSIVASFTEFATTSAFAQPTARPVTDVCFVSSPTDQAPTTSTTNAISISAGEVLTVASPSGSYAELKKRAFDDVITYNVDSAVTLDAPAPSDLTISIPGDQYPAFTNVAIPNIEPLLVSSPDITDPITANTAFSWTAGIGTESSIQIVATETSADFSQIISVVCTVIDDGSFEFPATTKAEMGTAFSGSGTMSRQGTNIQRSGNAVLYVSTTSARGG